MNTLLTAPQLAIRTFGLAPIGHPAKAPGICVCCGTTWEIGDLITPFSASDGFNDGRAIQPHNRGPKFICGACAHFFSKAMMAEVQRVIITEDGAYPIGKGSNRAWFLRNPPKPPFVVLFKDNGSALVNQHLIWRASVTLDADYWLVQHHRRTLGVRRTLVIEAARIWQTVLGPAFAAAPAPVKPTKPVKPGAKPAKIKPAKVKSTKVPSSPFGFLDPLLTDPSSGPLRGDIRSFAVTNGYEAELAIFDALNPAEQWALGALCYVPIEETSKPDPIDLSGILGRKLGAANERKAAKIAAKADAATATAVTV